MSKIKKMTIVYVFSSYLLWPMLPLVFGCLWGVDVGYAANGELPFHPGGIDLPSAVWWLFTPVTLPVALLILVCEFMFDGFFLEVIFPGVSPCLQGSWAGFSGPIWVTGWLVAYAISLSVATAVCVCRRSFTFRGKPRSLSLCLWLLCTVVSLLSVFVCKGYGPYAANLANEEKVQSTLLSGKIIPGEEKYGYRFVADNLAVPVVYRRGRRGRTLCKVIRPPVPVPQEYGGGFVGGDIIVRKDTQGKVEELPSEFVTGEPDGSPCHFKTIYKAGWQQ